jgi:hypothetical protein
VHFDNAGFYELFFIMFFPRLYFALFSLHALTKYLPVLILNILSVPSLPSTRYAIANLPAGSLL